MTDKDRQFVDSVSRGNGSPEVIVCAGKFDLLHGSDEASFIGLTLPVEKRQIVTVGRFEDPFAGVPVAPDAQFAHDGPLTGVDYIVTDVGVAVRLDRRADLQRQDRGVGILP